MPDEEKYEYSNIKRRNIHSTFLILLCEYQVDWIDAGWSD